MKKLLGCWLILTAFVLPSLAGEVEQPPKIKVWTRDSYFQSDLLRKSKQFVIPPEAKIRVQYEAVDPFGVEIGPVVINEQASNQSSLEIKETQIITREYSADGATTQKIYAEISLPEEIPTGNHSLAFHARSQGKKGPVAEAIEKISIVLLGGYLRVTGQALTFPSPFSVKRDGKVVIQYKLSASSNVDIYLISVSGERVKKISVNSGEKGGRVGMNKVAWDGLTDQGTPVANGIYLGTIVSRDEYRLLGEFKLTAVN